LIVVAAEAVPIMPEKLQEIGIVAKLEAGEPIERI
jgi:hypothetical protein